MPGAPPGGTLEELVAALGALGALVGEPMSALEVLNVLGALVGIARSAADV